MNVFILSSGRCGSVTFAWACSHMTNFKVGHETNCRVLGPPRFAYPDNFIEVDNRLVWMLGRLEQHFGDRAWYVHLTRDPEAVAASYNKRWHLVTGILPAYRTGILMIPKAGPMEVARDYVATANANITAFLAGKSHVMHVALETMEADFRRFWDWVGARGDMAGALAELKIRRNQNE